MPMTSPPDPHADRLLQLLDLLIRESPAVAGVIEVSDDIWAIHGVIPVDGDVILAEFGSYEEARSVLDQLPAGSHGHTPLRSSLLAPVQPRRLLSAAPVHSAAGSVAGIA
jgi:hypothetical protein